MEGIVITKLRKDPDGVWRARVSAGGLTVDVDRQYGSWQAQERAAPRSRRFVRRFVLPPVAAELQARLPKAERV